MESQRKDRSDALQVKEAQDSGHSKCDRSMGQLSLRALRGNQPCPHLNLRLLAPRAVRQYMSVVLSHQVHGTLL